MYKIQTKQFTELQDDSYIIGIDPGTHNGTSIYSTSTNQFLFSKTFSFWELTSFLETLNNPYKVIIEDIISNKPTFKRGMIFGAVKSKDPKRIAMSIAIFDKFAQDIGGNKRDQLHLLEWFERNNIEVIQVVPKKNSKTKLKHDEFSGLTQISTRLNEHTRDSCMLIYNYTNFTLST